MKIRLLSYGIVALLALIGSRIVVNYIYLSSARSPLKDPCSEGRPQPTRQVWLSEADPTSEIRDGYADQPREAAAALRILEVTSDACDSIHDRRVVVHTACSRPKYLRLFERGLSQNRLSPPA